MGNDDDAPGGGGGDMLQQRQSSRRRGREGVGRRMIRCYVSVMDMCPCCMVCLIMFLVLLVTAFGFLFSPSPDFDVSLYVEVAVWCNGARDEVACFWYTCTYTSTHTT